MIRGVVLAFNVAPPEQSIHHIDLRSIPMAVSQFYISSDSPAAFAPQYAFYLKLESVAFLLRSNSKRPSELIKTI